jgi:hypothetical protein
VLTAAFRLITNGIIRAHLSNQGRLNLGFHSEISSAKCRNGSDFRVSGNTKIPIIQALSSAADK